MSKNRVGEIEIDDIRLDWDEVAEIAGDLFDLHCGGPGGLRWAKSAWQVLSEAGLNRYIHAHTGTRRRPDPGRPARMGLV